MGIKNKVSKVCDDFTDLPVIGGLLKSRPKVAVVRLSGVIADAGVRRSGISYAKYEKILEDAFELYKLQAVALIINSPGGSPAQSALVGDHIRRLAEKHEVPVYAFIEDVAASGGYWLACAADKIYGTEVSIAGSIGVISASFGFEELIAKHGITRRVHTAGKEKSMLDPFLPEDAADIKRLKRLQKDLHTVFKNWVLERRGEKLSGKDSEYFEGQIWTGREATECGIIDAIGDVKSVCQAEFGEDVKFIEFAPERKLLSALMGSEAHLPNSSTLPRDIADVLEDRALWARYGL